MAVMNEDAPASAWDAFKRYPESVWISAFFAVYGLAIAILKDIPDIQGDKYYNISSYSVRLGPEVMLRYVGPIMIIYEDC